MLLLQASKSVHRMGEGNGPCHLQSGLKPLLVAKSEIPKDWVWEMVTSQLLGGKWALTVQPKRSDSQISSVASKPT